MHYVPHETPLKVNNLSKKKKHKIGEIGKKSEISDFFILKMVSNALGTPRNTFKRKKSSQKHIIGKNRIRLRYVPLG